VVPQDPFIFRSTLRQNLKVARPDADDALLERVCRQANAWEFILTTSISNPPMAQLCLSAVGLQSSLQLGWAAVCRSV
jgi:ABC-type transport system involved in Fe-S cluster assembly fused permease/ATPase subunit